MAAARSRRGSSSVRQRAAKYPSARARSTSRYMSANLCFTAWNEPIGTPNWWRSFTCPRSRSRIRWQAPTVVSATAVEASSRARRSATDASPAPRSRPPSMRTPSRWIRACLVVGSMGSRGSVSRSPPGTTARRSSPSMRRATATSSAVSPSTTNSLVPARTHPLPSAVAVATTSAGSQVPEPSSMASVPVPSPRATGPRNLDRSSSDPVSRIAGTNCVVVARKGPGAEA